MIPVFPRQAFAWYLAHFIGTQYRWGGDDPMAGFDCSGLIIEGLKAVGVLSEPVDMTANDLMTLFLHKQVQEPDMGCLVFYRNSEGRAFHVEACLNGTYLIGAMGGGSETLTNLEAIAQNAFVKVRQFAARTHGSSSVILVDPFMEG